jgi:hypothetical protein
MQLAGALDLVEFILDTADAVFDHAPIRFELGFARTAKKAEAAALAFEMGPRPHQPALLVRQMRVFDL